MPFDVCEHLWQLDCDDTGDRWWDCARCGAMHSLKAGQPPYAGVDLTEAQYDLLRAVECFSTFTTEDLHQALPLSAGELIEGLYTLQEEGFLQYDEEQELWRTVQ